MPSRQLLSLCIAVAATGAAVAASPHQHGAARLDIAVDARRVSIFLESPLHDLLGFERAPRTDAERQRADALLARLRDAAALFGIDPAAGCTATGVTLESPALGVGGGSAAPVAGDHADLQGRFDFDCRQAGRAGFVTVGLFEAFPGLARIEVQVATPRGQMKATLQRPSSRVALVR